VHWDAETVSSLVVVAIFVAASLVLTFLRRRYLDQTLIRGTPRDDSGRPVGSQPVLTALLALATTAAGILATIALLEGDYLRGVALLGVPAVALWFVVESLLSKRW
jgi:hypothetical protein